MRSAPAHRCCGAMYPGSRSAHRPVRAGAAGSSRASRRMSARRSSSPPSARRALSHPDQPVPSSPPLTLRYGEDRAVGLSDEGDTLVRLLEREHGARPRGVARRVRERLLRDPVDGEANARGYHCQVPAHPERHLETARARAASTRRRDLDGRWDRWSTPASSSLRSSATVRRSSRHAAAAHFLRRAQRLLGGRGVAAEHVPGACHLKHHRRQPVARRNRARPARSAGAPRASLAGPARVASPPAEPRACPGAGSLVRSPKGRRCPDPVADGDVAVASRSRRPRPVKRPPAGRAPPRSRATPTIARDHERQYRGLEHQRLVAPRALHEHNGDQHHQRPASGTGTPGRYAHRAKAATGTAISKTSVADDGRVTASTIRDRERQEGRGCRTSSALPGA